MILTNAVEKFEPKPDGKRHHREKSTQCVVLIRSVFRNFDVNALSAVSVINLHSSR